MTATDDDEFKDFDPRSRWAKINNDESYTPAFANTERKTYSPAQSPIKKFLETKHGKIWTFLYCPRSILEIADEIKIHPELIKYMIDELHIIYGVLVKSERVNKRLVFWIPDREMKKIKLR